MSEETKNVSKFSNLEPNVAATLSYILTPFTGIAFFIIEKENKFVRFHAMQSVLAGIAYFILWSLLASLIYSYLGFFAMRIVSLASFGLYLFLMWKAYNNEKYMLPFIGKLAEDLLEKQNKQL